MSTGFVLHPIGRVVREDGRVYIVIDHTYRDGLTGIEGFSHIAVCYWLHQNDNREKREALQVHPRGDLTNPLTGVFATHSPARPNPLAITYCELIRVDGCTLEIRDIDAFDGSPVIDIKCFIPPDVAQVRLPGWV